MKIYRIETLEFHPDPDQSIQSVRDIIEKTQDLTIRSVVTVSNYDPEKPGLIYQFDVRRKLELFPDTIK